MANLALLNDRVTLVPIQAINFGGSVVPLPAGDVESIASQTGSLVAFSIGTLTDGVTPALVCTPVPGGIDPGDTVTIADSDGLPSLVVGYTLNADTGAVAIQLNVAGSEFQPLPANPAQAATAKPVAEKVEPAAAATAPAAKPEEPKKA
jgi:hypothetical protein